MGYSGDLRHSRGDPGGEDRFVKVQQTIRRDLLAQLQVNAVQIQHAPVVAQRFVKLLFAGDLFGDIKLPANLLLGIKQGDRVAARGGIYGKGQAGRACAHNGQALWPDSRRNRHQSFVAGPRIDQTRGHFTGKDLIQAGLVTADTGIDLIGAPALSFGKELAVGQKRPGH